LGSKNVFPHVIWKTFYVVNRSRAFGVNFSPGKRNTGDDCGSFAALFLSSLNYTIVYRKTTLHGNCDGLSRVPLPTTESDDDTDAADVFAINQLESLPVSVTEVQHETRRDPVLSQVYHFVLSGWPKAVDAALRPYFTRRLEISIHQRCLLWGSRDVIPDKLRGRLLDQLQEGHILASPK